MRRLPAALVLAAFLALPAAPPSLAQEVSQGVNREPSAAVMAEQAEQGRALAERWCANCHLVGPQQRSAPGDAAPSFAAIAAQPGLTADWLRAYLRTPHANMPDYRLSNPQLDALAAYILARP